MADPWEGPRGPGPPVFLDQTEARRVGKKFFLNRPPSLTVSEVGGGEGGVTV